MTSPENKVLSLDDLAEVRRGLRGEGRRVVQCHGCFDVVHPGHIRYLRFAKSLGDVLIVSVSADDVVGKGFDRPYIPQDLRVENLAVLQFVDYVCIAEDSWAGPVLERLQPDVYVKGREYETSEDPRFARERDLVKAYGGEIVFGSGDVVFSSTRIIESRPEAFGLKDERLVAYCRRHGVSSETLRALLGRQPPPQILVLGDPILDHYVFCEGATVAPETPILSVSPVSEEYFVGGGALIACQLASLGAEVTFATTQSDDPRFRRLGDGLSNHGVKLVAIPSSPRPVFVKRRYIAGQHKLLKVNEGYHAPLTDAAVGQLVSYVESTGEYFDAVVATDFGYGFFGSVLCAALERTLTKLERPLYADVSTNGQANILKFRLPRLATPTESELRFALGDVESGLSSIAHRYLNRSGADRVIVTLGAKGCVSFSRIASDPTRLAAAYLPALAEAAVDSVGAGDLFLSGVVMGDLSGAEPPLCAYLGSSLAAIGVARMGNRAIDLPRLGAFLGSRPELEE